MKRHLIAALVLTASLSNGCTSTRETIPERSALEQLIVSAAVDHMAEQITVSVPDGAKVYVDSRIPGGFDTAYAVGAVRDRFARGGAALVNDRAEADLIAEVRAGVLSVDQSDTLLGIPKYELPFPFTDGFSLPELALWKRELRQGVVKVAVTTYDARTGRLQESISPVYGYSYRASYVVLLFFSWTDDDLIPEADRPHIGPLK